MKPLIGRVLGRFHHRVSRRLMRRQYWRVRYIVWVYPPPYDVMSEAGFQEVETYVSRCQNTVVQFIATRPIMNLCLAVERGAGSRVAKWWWEKDMLYLEGMQTADW